MAQFEILDEQVTVPDDALSQLLDDFAGEYGYDASKHAVPASAGEPTIEDLIEGPDHGDAT